MENMETAGDKKTDISVVIVNWNVRDFLKKSLESIYRFTEDVDFEVWVVDNNSSDGSGEMVAKEFPQVHLIANKENLGFSRANNMALTKSNGRYVLLLNPDTELIDNSLKAMTMFMDDHADIDAIGCKLIFPDGSLQYSARHFPSLFTDFMESLGLDGAFPKSAFFNYYKMGEWDHDDMRPIDVPYGASLLIRRNTLEKIGFMDERFFMYYDEIDLCYQIKKNGGKIYFIPDIKIIHNSNRSSNQIPLSCAEWKLTSKLLFYEKNYGSWSVFALFFNLVLHSIIIWGIFPVTSLFFKHPHDINYFKEWARFTWRVYVRYLKTRHTREPAC
ncbi:MAG: glycosyltransferase family 2 protein [Candidatus Omnitrophica bacterium]|nr:glycosyltransferase family 2 protein [Candidatus Omnitrophota bacterium]